MNYGLPLLEKRTESIVRKYCTFEAKPELFSDFSGHKVCKVADRLASRFPVSNIANHSLKSGFCFTNEYPRAFNSNQVSLAKTIAKISETCLVNERKVSIITGESGLLSCIPELSLVSKLIIQVDCDPVLLTYIGELIKKISDTSSISTRKYHEIIKTSLESLKRRGCATDVDEPGLLKSADEYKEAMGELHCFSSQRRLEEFQSALRECHIQAIEANYFSKEDMSSLFEILVEEGFEVSYFNISNVCEYFHRFYVMNPFNGLVQGMESTAYIRRIPLTIGAVCAYSSLLSGHDHTDTCTKNILFERLYQINKSKALSDVAMYAGKPKSVVNDLISACIELAKVDWIEVETCIDTLRLVLAHITKDEAKTLSHRVQDIEHSLAENTMYNDQDRSEFINITTAAVSAGFKQSDSA
ncbi:hypothetical protein [Parendozoicomonas sp. Alg238-R29]|uniref:hypothetical protein n=1 Tax=Parendozoicomonas sp. Alg238-R29 TaxID=2993446 RepID=UPI00248EA1E2|nr:hypothetical protein [Parendozoicomonas sp. Alg238-R29]